MTPPIFRNLSPSSSARQKSARLGEKSESSDRVTKPSMSIPAQTFRHERTNNKASIPTDCVLILSDNLFHSMPFRYPSKEEARLRATPLLLPTGRSNRSPAVAGAESGSSGSFSFMSPSPLSLNMNIVLGASLKQGDGNISGMGSPNGSVPVATNVSPSSVDTFKTSNLSRPDEKENEPAEKTTSPVADEDEESVQSDAAVVQIQSTKKTAPPVAEGEEESIQSDVVVVQVQPAKKTASPVAEEDEESVQSDDVVVVQVQPAEKTVSPVAEEDEESVQSDDVVVVPSPSENKKMAAKEKSAVTDDVVVEIPDVNPAVSDGKFAQSLSGIDLSGPPVAGYPYAVPPSGVSYPGPYNRAPPLQPMPYQGLQYPPMPYHSYPIPPMPYHSYPVPPMPYNYWPPLYTVNTDRQHGTHCHPMDSSSNQQSRPTARAVTTVATKNVSEQASPMDDRSVNPGNNQQFWSIADIEALVPKRVLRNNSVTIGWVRKSQLFVFDDSGFPDPNNVRSLFLANRTLVKIGKPSCGGFVQLYVHCKNRCRYCQATIRLVKTYDGSGFIIQISVNLKPGLEDTTETVISMFVLHTQFALIRG